MNVPTIEMPRQEARKEFLRYKRELETTKAKRMSDLQQRLRTEDEALMQAYKAIARGQMVIQLSEVIKKGGIGPQKLPRLAIARSDAQRVDCQRNPDGSVRYEIPYREDLRVRNVRNFPPGTLAQYEPIPFSWGGISNRIEGSALVPTVPIALRPHNLANYFTLWEVEKWEIPQRAAVRPPRDPFLLRHLDGDLYAVVAQWDLTELERAILAGR